MQNYRIKINKYIVPTLIYFFTIILSSQNSFSQNKIDDLTDAQVSEFYRKAQQSGLSEQEIEKAALSRGYSQVEVDKLRVRINNLKNPSGKLPGMKDGNTTNGDPRKVNTDKEQDYDEEREDSSENNEQKTKNTYSKIGQKNYPDLLLTENEFKEKIAALQAEKELKVYGSDLFSSKTLPFEANLRLPTPKNYILGAEDELLVDISGNSQMSYKLKLSPEGTIKIDNLSPIYVNGLTIEQASDRIINRLKTLYYGLNSQGGGVYAQVTLGNIRSIKVTVTGEVKRAGSYSVSSLATVFNALYQAGGPSKTGSYRNISVIRDGKVVKNIDLYEFLLKSDLSDNIQLRDQDLIRIGDYESQVKIRGLVKRQAIYEIKKGETLKNLLNYSGGFKDNAYTKSIRAVRITEKEKKLLNINSDKYNTFLLVGGDEFTVDTVLNRFENRVTIKGEVYRPGEYALDEEVNTVKALINAAEGLKESAFLNRALLIRLDEKRDTITIAIDLKKVLNGEEENHKLNKEDKLIINSNNALSEKKLITINGAIINPGKYDFYKNMTVADLIFRAGGFKESATGLKVEVSRRLKSDSVASIKNNLNVKIIELNVDLGLGKTSKNENFILEPFDVIMVKSSPNFEKFVSIKINGEIVFPGEYILKNGESKIVDLIKRAGGLKPNSFLEGIKIFRKIDIKSKDYKETLDKEVLEINKEVVSIDFKKAMDNPESLDNILLLDGDDIFIPKVLETIRITGSVLNPAIVPFSPSLKVYDYVSAAGGYKETASKKRVYVKYANGSSAVTNRILFWNVYPRIEQGAEVVVPEKDINKNPPATALEKAQITTALVSMVGIIITIIRAL